MRVHSNFRTPQSIAGPVVDYQDARSRKRYQLRRHVHDDEFITVQSGQEHVCLDELMIWATELSQTGVRSPTLAGVFEGYSLGRAR